MIAKAYRNTDLHSGTGSATEAVSVHDKSGVILNNAEVAQDLRKVITLTLN